MEEPSCKWCHDTGWISSRDTDGIAAATRCECVSEARAENLTPRAQIPHKYAASTLDNFVIPKNLTPSTFGHLQQIILLVKSYTRSFPMREDPRGILFYGGNGVGKTHLATATLRLILAAGFEGRFINCQALLRLIKESYDQPFGMGDRNAAYLEIQDAEVLLLDDLGSSRVTDWVEDTITDLIAQRHDNQRATIVTTNYSPVDGSLAARIGERATSRLREMCRPLAFPSDVEDHRGKKQAL
jgi:DNA replication protein DnaC